MIRSIYLLIGIVLISSACSSPPRNHEIRCEDLAGVSFRYTTGPVEGTPPVSPWHSVVLVWLGDPTGVTGRDLETLRVLEAPKRVFEPGEIGPSDPRFDPINQPLVPSLEFVFSSAGDARFRQALRSLRKSGDPLHHRAKNLALLLSDHLFLALSIPPADVWPPGPSWRVELTRERYDELVTYIESALGCT